VLTWNGRTVNFKIFYFYENYKYVCTVYTYNIEIIKDFHFSLIGSKLMKTKCIIDLIISYQGISIFLKIDLKLTVPFKIISSALIYLQFS
jgi:hypothetical protein